MNKSKHLFIIYKATNLINGKCYVGKTTQLFKKRKYQHISGSKILKENKEYIENEINKGIYFYNAINKYGIENFKWEVIYECNDILILNMMETFKIMVCHSHYTENGYNLTWGGDGRPKGYKHTEETKRKMSESKKGKNVGKKLSFHSIEKRSITRRENGWFKNPEKSKKKIREKRNTQIITEETKKKISKTKKGVPWSEARRNAYEVRWCK